MTASRLDRRHASLRTLCSRGGVPAPDADDSPGSSRANAWARGCYVAARRTSRAVAAMLALAATACDAVPVITPLPPRTPSVVAPAPGDAANRGAAATDDASEAAAGRPVFLVDFCLRPLRHDAIVRVQLQDDDLRDNPLAGLAAARLYRAAFDEDGAFGPATLFFDAVEHLGGADGSPAIRALQCHPTTDRVLVTLGMGEPMDSDAWSSYLWLLDPDGTPLSATGRAGDVRQSRVGWSPDGSRLLLRGPRDDYVGGVHWLDLATDRSAAIDGVRLYGLAGSGLGELLWTDDGRLGLAVSRALRPDGDGYHVDAEIDVLDMLGPSPAVTATQVLSDAMALTTVPGGVVYLASAPTERRYPHSVEVEVRVWDPASPGRAPRAIARFVQPGDEPDRLGAFAVVTQPGPATATQAHASADPWRGRFVFWTIVDRRGAIYLVDAADPHPLPDRITPQGHDVQRVRASGDIVGYESGTLPPRLDDSADALYDVGRRLHIVRLPPDG